MAFSILKLSRPSVCRVALWQQLLLPFRPIFSSVAFVDSSICLTDTVSPKLTNLSLLFLSSDIRFLGDPKVPITVYMQMSPKSVISSLNPSCLCACNYVTISKPLLALCCHNTFVTVATVPFRISTVCICHIPYPKCLFLLFFSRQNYYSSFRTQFKCCFPHEIFVEFSRQSVAFLALWAHFYHSVSTVYASVFPLRLGVLCTPGP